MTTTTTELAQWLEDNGFAGDADTVRELPEGDAVEARRTLALLARDVWWHFGHVGEEEDRPVYVDAERRIREVLAAL